MTPDQATIRRIVDHHFAQLTAPIGAAAAGKSPGVLVAVTVGAERHYFRYGEVPMAQHDAPEPAIEDIVVLIGSNTKVFSATLLALASVQPTLTGIRIGLTTPVASLLPDGIGIHHHDDQPILLWHLATHSAGFPDGPCGQKVFGDYTFAATTTFLQAFRPPYDPGLHWFYSDQGFALLGVLLSHAYCATAARIAADDWGAGYKDWPAIVHANVLAPLGMTTTQVDYAPVLDRLARPFGYLAGHPYPALQPPILVADSAGLGAGALSSTLPDMLTFLENQIAPPDNALGRAIALTQQSRGSALSMGLGWQIGNDFFYKNGMVSGYVSYMAVDTHNAIGLFAFANSRGGDDGATLCEAGRAALGALRGSPATKGHPSPCPSQPRCPGPFTSGRADRPGPRSTA